MSTGFARIRSGLRSNRRLSVTALSYASGRAESTINRILAGASAAASWLTPDQVEQVTALAPRAVVYVACDPAALARDVSTFAGHGFALASLRAFDLFPMTHHVECVALLTPPGRGKVS